MTRRRRRNSESLVDTLFSLPWQASFFLGIAVFVCLKWIFPVVGAGNMFLKSIAAAFSGMAWLFSGFFFLIGALTFAKAAVAKSKRPPSFPTRHVRPDSVTDYRSPSSAKYAVNGRTEPDGGSIKRGQFGEHLVEIPPIIDPLAEITLHHSRREPSIVTSDKPSEWTLGLLREIEWKRFEDVCQRFYETKGIRSETTPLVPDGGIDIRLFQDNAEHATSIVQCKAWGERVVGVKEVRELLGVMTHEKIIKAFFMTTGQFSDDAKKIATSNRITLIDGEMFLMMIERLPDADRKSLLDFATEGDFKIPSCPSCGIKMKHVPGKAGKPDFWGCNNYPRCRRTLPMRRMA